MVKRVPLKLEQKLTIVKLQMFQDHFNAADEEQKGGVTMTQFRQAVRNTIGDHVIDEDADMFFMKVDTYDSGMVSWEVRLSHLSVGYRPRHLPLMMPLGLHATLRTAYIDLRLFQARFS